MNTKPEKTKKLTKEQQRESECVHAMCVMLGANEAIKLNPSIPLGTKVFYRLMREEAKKLFLDCGGTIDTITNPGETLILPTQPSLKFYDSDIEAMRALVAEYDAKKTKKT